MVDCFHCLRHDAVVRCYNENSNIRGVGTAHTHCRECFMSRCIQECDFLSVDSDHICTDVLCDTACLAICHMRVADSVKKRSLAVVDMTHYADNRRTRNHVLFLLSILGEKSSDNVLLLLLLCDNIIFHRNFLRFLERDLVVHCDHLAFHEEILYECSRCHFHSLCKFSDRNFLRDLDLRYDFLDLGLFVFRLVLLESLRDTVELLLALIRT